MAKRTPKKRPAARYRLRQVVNRHVNQAGLLIEALECGHTRIASNRALREGWNVRRRCEACAQGLEDNTV